MSFSDLKNQYPGKIHFIGIGGIGMSAIALILKEIGCQVQGSDLKQSDNINNMEQKGIRCFIGHKSENISDDVVLVIKTSIIKENNPEILASKTKNIRIIKRSDMLAIIMGQKLGITIAGTHGKTSTTAMTAIMVESANLDPMVINGGVINYYGSNAKFGDGKFVIAESDESDGTFVDLPSYIGAVTNIEPEHLEFYNNDFEVVKKYFIKYITQIPADGMVAVCFDDPEIRKIYTELKNKNNVITYGTDVHSDIVVSNISFDIKGLKFDVNLKKFKEILKDITIPAYGIHNAKNALVAIAIGKFLGFSEEQIRKGLNNYSGVKRRFTKTGEVNGITIIDDYGHHPTEIGVVFKAAKELVGKNKLIAVFQPHKYTRTRDLFNEFCNAFSDVDIVIIADIYSAGQDKIEGINQDSLIDGIKKAGHKKVLKLNNENDLPILINDIAKSGDIVVCAGAGSISNWANSLPNSLKELNGEN